MPSDYVWKEGDTRPILRALLTEPDPEAAGHGARRGIDLGEATTVELRMRSPNGRRVVSAAADPDLTQDTPAEGDDHKTGRGWVAVDPSIYTELTEVAGTNNGFFLITWSGGATQRVPSEGYLTIEIEPAF